MKNYKCIYICDPSDEEEEEAKVIEKQTGLTVEYKEDPNFEDYYFDVLFFDWGGMSMGNSLMERFCSRIIDHAEEHPSRFYVMASCFTSQAMDDAIYELGDKKPANILLNIEELVSFLKQPEE